MFERFHVSGFIDDPINTLFYQYHQYSSFAQIHRFRTVKA